MKIQTIETREVEVKTHLTLDAGAIAKMCEAGADYGIVDASGYEMAGLLLSSIKTDIKIITDAWAPIKKSASDTHKKICAAENAALAPYKAVDAAVRKSMADYIAAEKARQRAVEAAAREAQRKEAERLLAEAIAAEQAGKVAEAAAGMEMAELVSEMRPAPAPAAPVSQFANTRSTWKARVTVPDAVPIAACGVEIRPIDISALNAIARQTKGTAQISGVEFYIEETVAVRGR